MVGPDLGEFRAQKKNLRRVIDPDQKHDDAAGRAIDVGGDEVGQEIADQGLAGLEQQSGAAARHDHVAPHQLEIGQQLVDRPEQKGDNQEGDLKVYSADHQFGKIRKAVQ